MQSSGTVDDGVRGRSDISELVVFIDPQVDDDTGCDGAKSRAIVDLDETLI